MSELYPTLTLGAPGQARRFTLAEARETLPLIKRLTAQAARELEPVAVGLRRQGLDGSELKAYEKDYERIVRRWAGKVERLGLVVKGLWLVAFDTGDGYLCWTHPEHDVDFYHAYHEGFAARRPLAEVIANCHPDWAVGQEKNHLRQ